MARELPPNLLRAPLLIASGCALANAVWSLFLWQQLRVARGGGEAFCAFGGGGCGALWDGAFASGVHDWTGLPVAAWGLVWSAAALLLTGVAWRRVVRGSDPGPAWSAAVWVALAGLATVVGLGVVSAVEGGFCSNCAVTYALVVAYAGVVLAAAWAARPGAWGAGAAWTAGTLGVLFLVLLTPGLRTPKAGAQLGVEALAGAGQRGGGPIAELEGLLTDMPASERQQLANALAHFVAAEPVSPRRARALVGAPMAPLRITAFTDSGCGHCAQFHEGLERVLETLPARTVAIDQRVFPLDRSCNPTVHGVGREELCLAARVRICLEDDPRAWELTGWLHHDAQPLSERAIYRVAERLAPRAELEACVASQATAEKLRDDIGFAIDGGILGTPFVLVNGRPASTYVPFLYVLALTAGDPSHPAFAALPEPVAEESSHEGHGH